MNFIIDYTILKADKTVLKAGQIIVKNKHNELHAKLMLEDYLRHKHSDFGCLIVSRCVEENDILKQFNDIFGEKLF